MPEGPEVECTKRSLELLLNKTVKKIKLTKLSQKYSKYLNKQKEFDGFTNKKLYDLIRKGKYLLWVFEGEKVILNHLGMSGKWVFVDNVKDITSHAKIILEMEKPPHAIFDDVRNFGQFRPYGTLQEVLEYKPIKKLGPDGLKIPFNCNLFLKLLEKKKYHFKQIGQVLLDQELVAGVGNIYKSEILFFAKIDPRKQVDKLTCTEKKKLCVAISTILQKAVNCNGSTFNIQPYKSPTGEIGDAQKWHKVYGREDAKCLECNHRIKRLKQDDRSTFFCSKCQK